MQSLVLGTAQWGGPYGITNRAGRLSDQTIERLVRCALNLGITRIDTASGYGDAQERLRPWAGLFSTTTKVNGSGTVTVTAQLEANCADLGVESVDTCLIHDWPSLTNEEATEAGVQLVSLRERGIVARVGVSTYDDADLQRAVSLFGALDVVQVPISVLDRRMARSITLEAMTDSGVQVQARSIFLQGLLAGRSTGGLGGHRNVRRFHDECAAAELTPVEGAISFIRSLSWLTEVVVGVTGVDELKEIAVAWGSGQVDRLPASVESDDLDLIDPRRWEH